MSSWKRHLAVAICLLICLLAGARVANATPLVSVDSVSTALGGGLYRYDYTLTNLGDPVADAGFDLYDLTLTFAASVSVIAASTGDWDFVGGFGFIDTFSPTPGTAPLGTDLVPGQTRVFHITVDGSIDNAAFFATFTNPNDPANPLVRDGSATAAASVPEPTSLVFLATGIATLLIVRTSPVAARSRDWCGSRATLESPRLARRR